MITVDKDGAVWITDVGRHQVRGEWVQAGRRTAQLINRYYLNMQKVSCA